MRVPEVCVRAIRSGARRGGLSKGARWCCLMAVVGALGISVIRADDAATQPAAPAAAMDPTIAAIREEGLNHSQVMQTLDYLCNVIGPRLTGSPNTKRANEWTRDLMTKWGLENAHLEEWGPFGRGWTLQRFSLEVVEPQEIPLKAYPKAWSPGVAGPREAEVVFIDAQNEAELAKYEGTLKDKVVLIGMPREIKPAFEPLARRFKDDELAKSETYPAGTPLAVTDVVPQGRGRGGGGGAGGRGAGRGAAATSPATQPGGPIPAGGNAGRVGALQGPGVAQRALYMATQEGALLVIDSSSQGDGGVIFVSDATVPSPAGGRGFGGGQRAYSLTAPKMAPQVTVASEDYDRMVRMIREGEKLKISVNLQVEYQTSDPMAYNTIAEIPGTDPELKDQIVMAGAHMDSWQAGTGATDNGAGVGTVLEAVRILKALNLKPKRTIRVALWTGEEEGLLGSRAYVRAHFGGTGAGGGAGRGAATGAATTEPAAAEAAGGRGAGGGGRGFGRGGGGPFVPGPEFDKLSIYLNLDNGTGKIRGIYGMGNSAAGPIFKKWFEPFKDLGADTVTLGTNGQTDHVSFDDIGLPGFGFIQDSIDYFARTHHSNADVYERLQADDLKECSTIMAAFLWDAANMDERFPRKPAPEPGARGRGQ